MILSDILGSEIGGQVNSGMNVKRKELTGTRT